MSVKGKEGIINVHVSRKKATCTTEKRRGE